MATQNGTPVSPPTESWPHARLIPTAGLRNDQERERRATSVLLAVMHGVPDFGHTLLRELGAPKSPIIETYTEVRFKDSNGKTVIPDGAIRCERGKKTWTCLVEVKTGAARLREDQISSYLDVAKTNGFDGVLTISTQITANSSESPISVDRRRLRGGLQLWHFSWWKVLTEAIVLQRTRGIKDSDQEWVLAELIHYLSSEGSGAVGFEDMGDQWVSVRSQVREGTLRKSDVAARDVAERWEQFTHYLCLGLSQELGTAVTEQRPRTQTTEARITELIGNLTSDGQLATTIRIPNAAGPVTIRADLRSRQTFTSVTLEAPKTGRVKPRFNWLTRQLPEAPGDLLLEASFPNARQTTAIKLEDARIDPSPAFHPADAKREPKGFVLTQAKPMGQKRGRDEGSFVRETTTQTFVFYRDIVQNLRAWQATAPQLPDETDNTEQPRIDPGEPVQNGPAGISSATAPSVAELDMAGSE
jgi:hypothetical protein